MFKFFKGDEVKFLATYFGLVAAHYMLPAFLGQIALIAAVIAFIISKKNYFWIALFFLMSSGAAGFFSHFTKFPMIGPAPIFVLVMIVMVFKYVINSSKHPVFYKEIFFVLVFIMLIYRFTTGINYVHMLKFDLTFLSLFILPTLIKSINEWKLFFKLLFLGLFIVLIGQWWHIFTGANFAGATFGITAHRYERAIEVDPDGFVRSVEGIFVSLIALIGSMFLLANEPRNRYYQIIAVLSFLSIWITATRGWMLASLIIVLPYLLKLNRKQFASIAFMVTLFILLITQVDFIDRQFSKSVERLSTIEYLFEGDRTAGGTLVRLTTRHQKVWSQFLERPVFGWGYSENFHRNSDPHVGNQNLLMQIGVFGFLFLIIFLSYFVLRMIKLQIEKPKLSAISKIVIFSLLGVFVLHSATVQLFGMGGNFQSQILIAVVLSLGNWVNYAHLENYSELSKEINLNK